MTGRGWGGWRPHAGRKPKNAARASEPHARREFSASVPIHVTARVVDGHPSLRDKRALAAIGRCFGTVAPGAGGRVCVSHYAVSPGHIHFLVDAADRTAFVRGLQGLFIRLAKTINRALARPGAIR